jgi:hypothetical protein
LHSGETQGMHALNTSLNTVCTTEYSIGVYTVEYTKDQGKMRVEVLLGLR